MDTLRGLAVKILPYPKLAVLATSLSVALPLTAQESTDQAMELVVVTGSYIQRAEDRPQPIQVTSGVEIQRDQKYSLGEIFRDMSITQGSLGGTAGSTDGQRARVNLRGLGTQATLTLLNGRRTTGDLNSLTPSIMIDRVEVLTDGASALYGSDAVAGVVNVLTRNDFEGVELQLNSMEIDRSGDQNDGFQVMFGSQGERTSIIAAMEYTTRDQILAEEVYPVERLYAARAFPFAMPPSLQEGAGGMAARFADPLCGDPRLGGEPFGGTIGTSVGGGCGYLLSLAREMQSENKRTTAMTSITHEFEGGIRANVELGASRSTNNMILNTQPINNQPRPVAPTGNPGLAEYISQGALNPVPHRVWMRFRMPTPLDDRFDPEAETKATTLRFAATLDGDLNDNWAWSATHSTSNDIFFTKDKDTLRQRFDDALYGYGGAGCNMSSGGASGFGPDGTPGTADDGVADPSCQWYNPFGNQFIASPGDPTYNSTEILNYMYNIRTEEEDTSLRVMEFVLSGNPTDWVGIAVGAQRRTQNQSVDYDPISNAGGFAFVDEVLPDFTGQIEADAIFAEAAFFPTDNLEIQLAARVEDYDTGASSTDPKLGLLWNISDSFALRASYGTSFSVGSTAELFGIGRGPGTNAVVDGDGPASGAIILGNQNLEPEESDAYSVGFTWDATDNLTFTLNYWSFDFTNLIIQEGPDIVFAQDAADGIIGNDGRVTLADTVTDASIVTIGPNEYTAPGFSAQDILGFNLSYLNSAFLETSGVDFAVDFGANVGEGRLGFRFDGTQTFDYDIPGVFGGVVDGVGNHNNSNDGSPIVETKANARISYAWRDHYIQFTTRYLSGLEQDIPDLGTVPSENKTFTTFDLLYTYSFDMPGGPLDLNFGAINLTDEFDPVNGDNLSTAQGIVYDTRGRVYRVALTKTF